MTELQEILKLLKQLTSNPLPILKDGIVVGWTYRS